MKPRGHRDKISNRWEHATRADFRFRKEEEGRELVARRIRIRLERTAEQQLTVAEMSEEDQNTVNRRLAIGIALTVGFIGFGLIPDDSIGGKPEKPLFFYLVPIARSREIYETAKS